jgi:hypothetical protein
MPCLLRDTLFVNSGFVVNQNALSHVRIFSSHHYSHFCNTFSHFLHFSLAPYFSIFSAASSAAIAGGIIVAFLAIVACIGGAFYYRRVEARKIESLSLV